VLVCAVACAPAASTTDRPHEAAPRAVTVADLASSLAAADHQPPRVRTYLRPLRELERRCMDGSVKALADAVEALAERVRRARLDVPVGAVAEAELVANARKGSDCVKLAGAIGRELGRPLDVSGSPYRRIVRFSPAVTAQLALAAVRTELLPGKERAVYELKAFSCQQAIYMSKAIGQRYGNSSLGAFVELTSGRGVGHGRYDASRVNRARITPLGRIGGEPCT
jgi:hypothetical protein